MRGPSALFRSPDGVLPPAPSPDIGRAHGFTLMEMLVTLMLVSFTTMLMFQMLGSYRIAHDRVRAQSGQIDRQALYQDWFRDSVHGLFIAEGLRFAGEQRRFTGITLNPLYAPEGSPTEIGWLLEATDGGQDIVYSENGRERWRLTLADTDDAHFRYLAADGQEADTWPPRVGRVDAETLPAVVVLLRQAGGREHAQVAAVLGPLKPPVRLYGEEQML